MWLNSYLHDRKQFVQIDYCKSTLHLLLNLRSPRDYVSPVIWSGGLKEYSSLQANPYNVRYSHTVLIVHIYFAPRGVDNV